MLLPNSEIKLLRETQEVDFVVIITFSLLIDFGKLIKKEKLHM